MSDKSKAAQISITLENDLLTIINDTATKSALSRSKFVEKCIRNYLDPPPGPDITGLQQTIEQQKLLLADGETSLKQTIAYHEQLLKDKDVIIKDKDTIITEITNQNNWLRGEYAKLNDRLNALLLTPPKNSIWEKLGLRRKKVAD